MSDYKLDRTAFKKLTFQEADKLYAVDKSLSLTERLSQGYYLSLKAYGFSLENQPKLDRKFFSCRKLGK